MMGDGRGIDLYKLFNVVKWKGGYDVVCDNKSWDVVASESGFDSSFGSSVKLVYTKYLLVLDSWLKKVVGCGGDGGKVLADYALVDSRDKFRNQMIELHNGLFEEFKSNVDECQNGKEDMETMEYCVLNESVSERYCKGFDDEHAMYVLEDYGSEVEVDAVSTHKRKSGLLLEDMLSWVSSDSSDKWMSNPVKDMLNRVSSVAANPCDPIVGLVPEKLKWKSCVSVEVDEWRKVLSLREATFAKRSFESRTAQRYWLSQKLHPSLYDENPEATNKFRERLRSNKSISTRSSTPPVRSSLESLVEAEGGMDRTPFPVAKKQPIRFSNAPSSHNGRPTLLTRIGPCFQAVLPDWTGMPSKSDSKWYGTQIWPSRNASSRFLIERDPMGKGRQDSCGCLAPGSEECVRFHISDKRDKVKLELGPAFNEFSFDKAGEQVRRLWTNDEEEKFKDVVLSIISSSSQSNDKFIWDDIFRSFPKRSREDLVSYYYNVFLYQRRGYQNRHTPDEISSDDEESNLRCTFGHMTEKPRNQRQKSKGR